MTSEIWEIGFVLTNPAGVPTLPTPDEWSRTIGGKLASIEGHPNPNGTMQVQAVFLFTDLSKIPNDRDLTYMFPSGIYATVNNKKFISKSTSGTDTMMSKPEEAAATSAGMALLFGAIGAGLGHFVKHPTIGAVAGATLGAAAGASFAHIFEDANFFGAMTQSEVSDIKSNITKVSVSSAIGAAVAGTVGAKMIRKHPTVAAILAASTGGAVAAAVADKAFGTPTGKIGTGDWSPVGVFS